ncbi:hypothetical protein JTB14_017987 [Gonioctena quinquepunctata]|nr:hypothetical protein JTB14_017987 [Gonioctena quinquepunctata]
MFKRNYKENVTLTESVGDSIFHDDLKIPDNLLSRVIGPINVKKWNAMKILFSSKTNEEFVTRLLDIAQEFLNRQDEREINNVQLNKQKKLNNKSKLSLLKIPHNDDNRQIDIIIENVQNVENPNRKNENNDNNENDAHQQLETLPKTKTEKSKKITKYLNSQILN